MVLTMLGQQPYTLLEAGDPEAALRLLREYPDPIHLLLTDVNMPGMNGFQVAERAIQRRPSLKVLYMSGFAGDFLAQQRFEDRPLHLLQKPFSPESRLLKVREALT